MKKPLQNSTNLQMRENLNYLFMPGEVAIFFFFLFNSHEMGFDVDYDCNA